MPSLIDSETSQYLKQRFEKDLKSDVELIVYSSDASNEYAQFATGFINELAQINSHIKVIMKALDESARADGVSTDPSIRIGKAQGYQLLFNGVPAGHEAGTFVETIIMVSQAESGLSEDTKKAIRSLEKEVSLQVFVTPTCPHCPHMAQLAFKLAIEHPAKISAEVIEASENPGLSKKFGVSSVPQQLINWDKDSSTIGVQSESKYLEKILSS